LAAGRLIAEGIEALVETRGVLGTSWLNPGHTGGVVVLVPIHQAERARQLLREVEDAFEPEFPPELVEDARLLTCPECGSTRKYFRRANAVLEIISLRSMSPDLNRRRWICRDCGNIWSVDDA
jgi:rubrerythrin